jgi:type III secretion protein T
VIPPDVLAWPLAEYTPPEGAVKVWTMSVALYMVRFVAAMALLPVLADGVVTMLPRMGIALLLAAYMAMGRSPEEVLGLTGGQVGLIAVKEAVIGVILGFAMGVVFWIIEQVGALIDTAAGFNNVQVQNPMSGEQNTPVSNLLVKLAGAVFFALGGALYFAQVLFESYRVWPLVDLTPSLQGAQRAFIDLQVGELFGNTMKLAAPILIVVFLIDVGVALLARSAEKLEPTILAQPIKCIVSVLMLALFVSVAFELLQQHLLPLGLLQQLAPAGR